MDALAGNLQVVKADIPLAEVMTYASQLKSMTGGQGSYTIELKGYEAVPPNVQAQIVAAYQKARGHVEEE
jgi:elongation factor G